MATAKVNHSAVITRQLKMIVDYARENIPTESEHAIPNHRADERVRDLLEEVLHAND